MESNAARGLRAIGITKHGSDEEEKAAVAKAAVDHGVTWPTYIDASGAWNASAGIRAEPVFMLLDRKGKVAYRHAGKLLEGSPEFAEMTQMLAKM